MSLNTSSNNNFTSIDSEFGLTTNNSVRSTSISDSNNPNTEVAMQSTFTNVLEEQEEYMTFGKTDAAVSTDGIDIPSGLPMKSIFFNHFTNYSNPNARTEMTLFYNVEHALISWRSPQSSRAYKIATNLIRVYEALEAGSPNKSVTWTRAYNSNNQPDCEDIIRMIARSVMNEKTVAGAAKLLQSLVGTMFVAQWEVQEENPDNYNTAAIFKQVGNLVDAQAVLRTEDVAAFHVNSNNSEESIILNKAGRTKRTLTIEGNKGFGNSKQKGSAAAWVEGCLDWTSRVYGFALSDKTNTKRGYVGDAVTIMGVSADGMKSLVTDAKEGKAQARHAMIKHTTAEVENPVIDGLISEMTGNRFAVHYGARLMTTYVDNSFFSASVGDGGAVLRTPLTATINKKLSGSVNIDLLRCTNGAWAVKLSSFSEGEKLEAVRNAVKAEIVNNPVLAPGQSIMFEGQVVLQNTSNLELKLAYKDPIHTGIKDGTTKYLNTQEAAVAFDVQYKAVITDWNWKLRGLWLKEMTTRNNSLQFSDKSIKSDVIINGNSVKNKKAMLVRLWANYNRQLVAFCKDGSLRLAHQNPDGNVVLGKELDLNQVQADLDAITVKTKVSFVASAISIENHKLANANAFTGATITELNNGLVRVEATVKTITAPLVQAIELSSVAENFSVGRKVSPITAAYITTFAAANEVATRTITANAERVAQSIRLGLTNKVDAVFDTRLDQDLEALVEALSLSIQNGRTPKGCFKALAQRFPQGIKVTGADAKCGRKWEVVLPTHLLATQGRFDKFGWSFDENIQTIYAFLNLLAFGARKAEVANSIADYAYAIGHGLKYWRDDVIEGKGSLTKSTPCFDHHGMKVVANAMAGYEMIGGKPTPVIMLDESNPLVVPTSEGSKKSIAIGKDGRNAKLIKDGDVVFFHRNPVIDLTPAIVRISKKQRVAGKYVAAISPDAFAYGGFGDFDGDCIWLIPANQVGIRNIDANVTSANTNPAEQVASLMEHPLVGKNIACKTMKRYSIGGSEDEILSGVCKVTGFDVSGAIADRTEEVKLASLGLAGNDQKLIKEISLEGRLLTTYRAMAVSSAESTARHYRIRVGQGYSVMFNAYSDFIAGYNPCNNSFLLEDATTIKASSFYVYEHIGLSGFSSGNEEIFETLIRLAEERLGNRKREAAHPCIAFYGEVEVPIDVSSDEVRRPVAKYVAMTMIQSRLNRSNGISSSTAQSGFMSSAIKHGVFRALTKGVLNSSNQTDAVLLQDYIADNNPYAPVMTALAKAAGRNFGRV